MLVSLILSGTLGIFAQAVPPAPQASGTARQAGPGPSAAQVRVTGHANALQVEVPEQASLSTVLSSVCREQKIKCTGTETLAGYKGPAMTVEGTLRQVVSKLLEGTDVNYEFSRSADGGATEISFLGHAPHGTTGVPSPAAAAEPKRPMPLHSMPFPGKAGPAPAAPSDEPAPAPTGPGVSSASPAPDAQSPAADAQSDEERNLRAITDMFKGTGNSEPAQFLPFPDSHGQPIPVVDPQEKPAVLPFPDQFGNPIPAKPPVKDASPFPPTNSASTDNKQ